jgi:hypothetical protein
MKFDATSIDVFPKLTYLVQILDAVYEFQFAVFAYFPVNRPQRRIRELLEECLR